MQWLESYIGPVTPVVQLYITQAPQSRQTWDPVRNRVCVRGPYQAFVSIILTPCPYDPIILTPCPYDPIILTPCPYDPIILTPCPYDPIRYARKSAARNDFFNTTESIAEDAVGSVRHATTPMKGQRRTP